MPNLPFSAAKKSLIRRLKFLKTSEKAMDVVLSKPEYIFAGFRLNPERRLLFHHGEIVNLHPKAFDLLLVLLENRDRILSKNELLDLVWANQFVEENNLAVQIFTLRKIFGEKKHEHNFIVNVPGKGYRFVAKVETEFPNQKDIFEADSNGFSVIANDEKLKTEHPEKIETRNRKFIILFLIFGATVLVSAVWGLNRFWRAGEPEQAKQLNFNRLTTTGKITNATLSPDGKYAVFAQRETDGESLWLKQIESGSQTRIVAPAPLEYVGLTVSPDNGYIYFSVFTDNKTDGWVRRMPIIGGNAQEIAGVETGISVTFAPDGKRFAFTKSSSSLKETHLVVSDADGANRKTLIRAADHQRKFPTFKANPAAWSPDGKFIACAVSEKNADGMKAGILLVNPSDGSERFLVARRFAWIDHLAWTDAENVAFVASETDEWSSQIWTVSLKTGEARHLTNDLQKYQWLSAAHGNLLAVQENSMSELRIADLDKNFSELKTREILHESNTDYVAFGSNKEIYYVSQASGKREIWRVGQIGANPSQITSDARVSYGFAVSPADGSIVFASAREGGRHALWKADANGENFSRLTDGDDLAPQFSADGTRLIFQRGLNEFPTVWKLDAISGEAAQLSKEHSLKPAISPDGSLAAYFFMDFTDGGAWRIRLIRTTDGSSAGILNLPMTIHERRLRWHPSGKFLSIIFSAGENLNLLLLPTDGSAPKIIGGLGKGELSSFDWSADGKQIVFSKSDESTDVVLLSGF